MAERLSTKVIKGVSVTSLEGAKALVAAGQAQKEDFWGADTPGEERLVRRLPGHSAWALWGDLAWALGGTLPGRYGGPCLGTP